MTDIEIGYKSSTIASMSSSGSLTLNTAGKYCEDNITVTYDKVQGSAFTPATTISVTPTISIDSNGLITANNNGTSSITPTVTAGYITSGTAGTITVNGSNTSQLTTQAASTWTPTTTSQIISSGTYLTGNQTIAGDSNLVASNIASGVSIFGVNGTFQGGGDLESITVDTNNLLSQSTTFSSPDLLLYQNNNFNKSITISTNSSYTVWFDPFIPIELNEKIHLYMELSFLCSDIDETITIDSDYTVITSTTSLTFISSSQNSNINQVQVYYNSGNLRFAATKKSGSTMTAQISGQIIITKVIDGMDTITINLLDNPQFLNIYKSLAYRSVIASSAPGVSEWCNSLSTIEMWQFCAQKFSGNFVFNNVSSVGQYAFAVAWTGNGTSIHSPSYTVNFLRSSGTSLDQYTFYNNGMIKEINGPYISIIPSGFCQSCISLTTVSFSECTTINTNAFISCRNLTTVSFPECITIGNNAFSACGNLTTASFPECTSIGAYAFQACNKLITVSFSKCTNIDSYAFRFCSSLATISFPKCTTINGSAFQSCINLTTVSFPECTSIGSSIFSNCQKLESVYLMGSSIPTLGTGVFNSTPITVSTYLGYFGSIYVPSSLLASYKTATNWATYSNRMVGI